MLWKFLNLRFTFGEQDRKFAKIMPACRSHVSHDCEFLFTANSSACHLFVTASPLPWRLWFS